MEFEDLCTAARANHRRDGSTYVHAELPAPLRFFSSASAALAALVAQAQAAAGLPTTGEIDAPTMEILSPAPDPPAPVQKRRKKKKLNPKI